MKLEFQNSLFRSRSDMCAAIAQQWVCANGANDRETILPALNESSDYELADQCIDAWGLGDDGWMDERNIDRDDIASAFADVRENPAAAFGWHE